jgi:hypothetical protein
MTGYTWNLSKTDPMIIEIFHNGNKIMGIFLGEAMESAGRTQVMRHVKECDNTPWLMRWHDDPFEIIKNSK